MFDLSLSSSLELRLRHRVVQGTAAGRRLWRRKEEYAARGVTPRRRCRKLLLHLAVGRGVGGGSVRATSWSVLAQKKTLMNTRSVMPPPWEATSALAVMATAVAMLASADKGRHAIPPLEQR
jgi:hypothetical protein